MGVGFNLVVAPDINSNTLAGVAASIPDLWLSLALGIGVGILLGALAVMACTPRPTVRHEELFHAVPNPNRRRK